jgi:hypothetical protein
MTTQDTDLEAAVAAAIWLHQRRAAEARRREILEAATTVVGAHVDRAAHRRLVGTVVGQIAAREATRRQKDLEADVARVLARRGITLPTPTPPPPPAAKAPPRPAAKSSTPTKSSFTAHTPPLVVWL